MINAKVNRDTSFTAKWRHIAHLQGHAQPVAILCIKALWALTKIK
jgi:hypothetical protein